MMTYCKIENGLVVNCAIFADVMPANWADPSETWVQSDVGQIGWTYDGKSFAAPAPPPRPPLTQYDYKNAIQGLIDQTAQARQYTDGVSLATYVTSSNPSWKSEAIAFVDWRDQVWDKAYDILAQVMAGNIAQPDISTFMAQLPSITWPA